MLLLMKSTIFNCEEVISYCDVNDKDMFMSLELLIKGDLVDLIERLYEDFVIIVDGMAYSYKGYKIWELYLEDGNTRLICVK